MGEVLLGDDLKVPQKKSSDMIFIDFNWKFIEVFWIISQ